MSISAKPNKVKFNLKNVHVAKLTESDGQYSFATPKALPGAVNLSLDAEGESNPFYADDIVYFRSDSNNGYSGTLELALVPDWFRQTFLREILDGRGVLVESANITDKVYFALLFEFAGDAHKIRHCMYKCSVSRPSVASQTKEASTTPVTETLNITCDPLEDGIVKTKTTADTTSATYTNWFQSVYLPQVTQEQLDGDVTDVAYAKLSSLTLGSLSLSPAFDPDITSYAATTTNNSNTITAAGADSATASITVNGSSHTSGNAATWQTGSNTVVVTATKSGCTPTAYVITVTKEEE